MEESLHDVPLFREFARSNCDTPAPDESTILRFCRLLEDHKLASQILALVNELPGAKGLMLRAGKAVDASMIATPSATKNASDERDLPMKQSQESKPVVLRHESPDRRGCGLGPAHIVRVTAGNASDVTGANTLLHDQESEVRGDAGCQGASKRPDAKNEL
jgi:IS5 family transposase